MSDLLYEKTFERYLETKRLKFSKKTKLKAVTDQIWDFIGKNDNYPYPLLIQEVKMIGVDCAEEILFRLSKEDMKCARIVAWRGEVKKNRMVEYK